MSEPLLFAVPTIMSLAFNVAALLYVGSRPADGGAAKRWAIVALCIFLMLTFGNLVIPAILARVFSTSNIASYFAIYGILGTLLHMTGVSFLIAAVFTGRQSTNRDSTAETGGAGVSDHNPYSAISR